MSSNKFRQMTCICGAPFATTEGEKKGRKTCHRLSKPANFGAFVDRENGAVREASSGLLERAEMPQKSEPIGFQADRQ